MAWRWITPEALARLLDDIVDAGFHFVDLEAFTQRLERPAENVPSEVLLTFHQPDVQVLDLAWPLLEARGIRPVLFVRTAYVGRRHETVLPGTSSLQLSWPELRFLSQRGASVQSAGHYGLDPRRAADEVVCGDLLRSRRELEKRLEIEALAFGYPTGRADERYRWLAGQAGFRLGFVPGLRPPFDSPLALGRMELRPLWNVRGVPGRLERFSGGRVRKAANLGPERSA